MSAERSVVAVIEIFEREIVVTNRRGRPNDLCLPGGKMEPNEFEWQALARELSEELGGVRLFGMGRLFQASGCFNTEYPEKPYLVTAFRAFVDGPIKHQVAGEERVRLVSFRALLEPDITFLPYYEELFGVLGWTP